MKKLTLIALACILSFQYSNAQVSVHTHRIVKQADMQEYLKRETTYWHKLAESEVLKGNLTFWGVFVRVGGEDMGSTPNVLLINGFNDIDTANQIWGGVADLFPDVAMEDIGTGGLSKTTDMIYLRGLGNHTAGDGVVPDDDFKYIRIIYHNSKNVGTHLDFEENKWKPMIQQAMNDGNTTMKGWGNARILSPESSDFQYTSYSYDLFASLADALGNEFSEDFEFEDGFFSDLQDNSEGPRNVHIYRIVDVVTPPPSDEDGE